MFSILRVFKATAPSMRYEKLWKINQIVGCFYIFQKSQVEECLKSNTVQKMNFSIKDFYGLFIFSKEILNFLTTIVPII